YDDARSRGHYLSVIIASERGELLRFHERRFLAGIDPRPFHWRQRGVRNWIGVIPRSGNNHAFYLSRFGCARQRQQEAFIWVSQHSAVCGYGAGFSVRSAPTRFIFRFIVIVTIDVVIVSCDNRRGNG